MGGGGGGRVVGGGGGGGGGTEPRGGKSQGSHSLYETLHGIVRCSTPWSIYCQRLYN